MQPRNLTIECAWPDGAATVAVRHWGPPDAPAVVCVHGLSRNATDFDELARVLAPGFQVAAIDMPGRGRSAPLADPARYTTETYLHVARRVMDSLRLQAVHWVGTSMGGLLGMRLAAGEPQRIRSLVLNDVGAELDGAELARLRAAAAERVTFADIDEAEHHFRSRYAAFGPMADARWRHLAEHGVWSRADFRLEPAFDVRAVDTGPLPAAVRLWDVWERVRCHVLVLRGGESRLLTRDTCERMAAGAAQARWIEFAEAGHAPDLHGSARIEPVCAFIEGATT